MFNEQIILSGILLYIGNVTKNVPVQIWSFIKSRLGLTLSIDSTRGGLYDKLNEYLLSIDKKVLNNHTSVVQHWDRLQDRSVPKRILDNGSYTVCINKTIIVISKARLKADSQTRDGDPVIEEIKIFLLGFNSHSIKDDMIEFMNKTTDRSLRNYLQVIRCASDFVSRECIMKRSMDTVYMKDKDKIIRHLDKFVTNEKFYKSRGLAYKTGILLSGPPGTGKSSVAKAMASYLNYNIVPVELQSIKAAQLLNKLNNSVERYCLVLFEDIDCVMDIKRDEDDDKQTSEAKEEKKAKLQIVLNYLDGLYSPDNVVFVASTNHKDRLDWALIRDGRFDLKLEMNDLEEDLASDMCRGYDMDPDIVLEGMNFPISPSTIQRLIMEKIM